MSEFIGLDPASIPFAVNEAAGDLEIWRGDVLLAVYPWHTHAEIVDGRLYAIAVPSGRVLREFAAGTWSKVCNTRK